MTVISQLTLMLAACSRQGRNRVYRCRVCWVLAMEASSTHGKARLVGACIALQISAHAAGCAAGCSHLYDCHCEPHDNGPHANTTP